MSMRISDGRGSYFIPVEGQPEEFAAPEEVLDVRKLRDALELSQTEFARITGFGLKSVSSWENNQTISAAAVLALWQLQDLQEALSHNLAAGTIGAWLRRPNSYFGGASPIQLIEQGRISRIWRFLYRLEAGEPS